MTGQPRSALILYGSETGNAQDMAEELGKLCQRLHFSANVEEMNSIDTKSLLRNELVLFVISTTGQGDMPHNSLAFWKRLLRRKLPPGCLSSLRYTIFGLGDSTYLKFNWAARKLSRRLDQLGAQTFMEGFEADEQFPDGIDGSFVRWADRLREFLLANYPHPDGLEQVPDHIMLPARWSLEPPLQVPRNDAKGGNSLSTAELPANRTLENTLPVPDAWVARISGMERMTPESHWQDVRLVTFDVPSKGGKKLNIDPGDCLTLYPRNFPEDVQKVITLMKWNQVADKPLDLALCESLPRGLYAELRCTLRDLLMNNIDIHATPRRSFLKSISYFTDDADHKERLLDFTQAQYIDEYFDYATRSRRTILEVLEEFTSVQVPPERLLDVFPLIHGRDFSIANGGAHINHPTDPDLVRVQLLIALVKYRTILRKPREGLCSRYIASLPLNATIHVTHKPVLSPVHGVANSSRALVAMATGTGVAPIRSLIHERLTHASTAQMTLFFGNRSAAADFFFREEWESLQKEGRLQLHTAFSRDQREKIYIQDLIRRDSAEMERAILHKAIFTVCGGSTKMAEACKRATFDPFTEKGDKVQREQLASEVTWWQEIW